jgi:Fur family transcriptional regulator, ferric uptake regulator
MTDMARRNSPHTRRQAQVYALLDETGEFRSAQRIHADLRGRGIEVGLTTVYRTLGVLADAGEIDAVRRPNGEQVYRHCSPTRHHHLMCRSCARTVEVAGPAVERWVTAVAQQHGFSDVNHSVEIFGTCDTCADARP